MLSGCKAPVVDESTVAPSTRSVRDNTGTHNDINLIQKVAWPVGDINELHRNDGNDKLENTIEFLRSTLVIMLHQVFLFSNVCISDMYISDMKNPENFSTSISA
jgi:hypothetical protein